jgi:hypothetical protein
MTLAIILTPIKAYVSQAVRSLQGIRKKINIFFISPMSATYFVHLILLRVNTLTG